jgi:quinol monooxygenase YgiN
MIIAHVTFTVASSSQARALSTLVDQAATVRRMKGCHTYIPFANPNAEGGVGVMHEWETWDDFAGYLASESFALANGVLRPLMIGAPTSRRFDANLLEAPD